MSISSDCTTAWFIATFEGTHTRGEWERYAETTRRFLGECAPGAVIIHVVKGAYASPEPAAQARIAAAMEGAACMHNVSACVFIVDSVMARAALMAINWQAPKPFPEEVFGDPARAWAWLAARVEPQRLAEAWRALDLTEVTSPP
jgi:hypothetical protein